MKKNFKKYGELKVIEAEEFNRLSYNPYRFSDLFARTEDGLLCEIYSCGNAAKKMNIPQYIAVCG